MLSLLTIIGLCIWIYYCNQRVQKQLVDGTIRAMLVWSYVSMLTAVIIVAFLIYSLTEQLLKLLDVFYHH